MSGLLLRGWSCLWSLIFMPSFGPPLAFLGHGVSQRSTQSQLTACLKELLLVPRQGKSKDGRMNWTVSFSGSLHLDLKLLRNKSLWCRCHTMVNVGRDLCTWSSPIYVHTCVCIYMHTHKYTCTYMTSLMLLWVEARQLSGGESWEKTSPFPASGTRGMAGKLQLTLSSSEKSPYSCGVSSVYV